MESIIKKAFIQMLGDTLNEIPQTSQNCLREGYVSSIDIVFDGGKVDRITFVSSKEFLEVFGFGLLGESAQDDLEFRDLSQELANLAIGLAKVLAIKEGVLFNIKTPQVYGISTFNEVKIPINFVLNGAPCSLYIS